MLRWPDAVVLVFSVLMLALATGLVGCTTPGPVAVQVSRAIAHYCAEPQASREAYRAAVAPLVAPHAIRVTCAQDGQGALQGPQEAP